MRRARSGGLLALIQSLMALALGPEEVSHSAGNMSVARLEAGLGAGLFAVFIFDGVGFNSFCAAMMVDWLGG